MPQTIGIAHLFAVYGGDDVARPASRGRTDGPIADRAHRKTPLHAEALVIFQPFRFDSGSETDLVEIRAAG